MTEDLLFLQYPKGNTSHRLFVHSHLPHQPNGNAFLFLNPILDEKRRVQNFQAETARLLCDQGIHVFRFDYLGTGDSTGHTYEFDLNSALDEARFIISYIREHFSITHLAILGIRYGADLALLLAQQHAELKQLVLIEPIIEGSRYLKELKIRRIALFYLAKMKVKSELFIDGNRFIDQQGYPISQGNIDFLESRNLDSFVARHKTITLYKLSNQNSTGLIHSLKEKWLPANKVIYKEVSVPDFWLFGVKPDAAALTKDICTNFNFT